MKHGSLFSGIGGFDLAAEWMGWENKFHCEWNEFGQKVLHHYWPKAELFTDITKSDFKKYNGTIDIISGGFPCQPYSSAGKRLGKEDSRHLWPEMLRAIREIQPRWVVGENVRGLTNWNGGLVFDEVQADLEAEGYEVTPFLLPACAVNAPHRRDRIWFVAYSRHSEHSRNTRRISREANEKNAGRSEHSTTSEQQIQLSTESSSLFGITSDSDNDGYKTNGGEISKEDGVPGINRQEMGCREFDGADISRDVADTTSTSKRTNELRGLRCKDGEIGRKGTQTIYDAIRPNGSERDATNTSNIGRENALEDGQMEGGRFRKLHKRGTWDSFPSVSPICTGNDGISDRLDGITFPKWRNESIKAAGNAIVPQVVYQIFKAIEQYEKQHSSINSTP